MKDLEILNPTKEIKIGNDTVSVSELPWPDALAFIKKLSGSAGKLIQPDGSIAISFDKLAELVTDSQDLAEWLILKSTGKDPDWLAKRTFSEGLELLDVALSLNLRPDFFDKAKRIMSRFNGAIKMQSVQPSTSSSGKDTPTKP